MKTLVTGVAGFIGSAVSQKLLDHGDTVVGLDIMNDYQGVELKDVRITYLQKHDKFLSVNRMLLTGDVKSTHCMRVRQ